jgi:hypothetical protein
MKGFKEAMKNHQIKWRETHLPNVTGNGWQNGRSYEHIPPLKYKWENFYPGIREALPLYIENEGIQPHTGIHNLLSSWVVCANFYWPFNNEPGYVLLKEYLNERLNLDITKILSLELEYQDNEQSLSPSILLGEDEGKRGSGQTSPDLAIKFISSNNREGILLIESKFTEHNFYSCSGYSKTKPGKPINRDKSRCLNTDSLVSSDFNNCHLIAWERKYWSLLKSDLNEEVFRELKRCPMSTSCYQLFRQQALAKGYESKYNPSVSCVVADSRNNALKNSLSSLGLDPLPDGWGLLFPNLPFKWFTHNDWFQFVNLHNGNKHWSEWIDYIEERYMCVY